MNEPLPCIRCGEPIHQGEKWEYYQGVPRIGTEQTAARIHARCVSALIKETLNALAAVPEDQRERVTFEI